MTNRVVTTQNIASFQAYTVATVPPVADHPNSVIFVSNGAAGSPIMAYAGTSAWLRCDTGGALAAA